MRTSLTKLTPNLDEMAQFESLAEIRFRKRDILSLAEVLEIPEKIRCHQNSTVLLRGLIGT